MQTKKNSAGSGDWFTIILTVMMVASLLRTLLMAHNVELHYSALTDTGMVRTQNEDAISVLPLLGVAMLADGMGGYRAGEVASRIAIEVCTDVLQDGLDDIDWSCTADQIGENLAGLVEQAVVRANRAIYNAALQESQYAGMGTTLVVTLMHHNKVIVAHVGDSRLYRLRDGALTQITRDHSQIQDQIDAGLISVQQARFATNRNLVTRAMGIDSHVEVDLNQMISKTGDMYLLCSDGLTDMVDDPEIAQLLGSDDLPLDEVAAGLVERANLAGGVDNVSVILIRIAAMSVENPGLLGRMLDWVR